MSPDKTALRLAGACLLALAPVLGQGAWTPPRKPDPSAILREAEADAKAKRYRDALEKQIWFHHNALRYDQALYGVRLSFALASWLQLGRQYPPALDALKEARDQAGMRILEGRGRHGDFHDFSAINELLAEERATADLFEWLDQNDPALARRAYGVAQSALISMKRYRLCGKYIDSKASTARVLRLYREQQRLAGDPRFGPDLEDFAERNLAHSAATLVALLALNERGAEADAVVAAVLAASPQADLKIRLERARKGALPEPWPRRADRR